MAEHPVTIQRQSDGRHHVTDAGGKVLGKHKSVFSAARQIHEYYGSTAQDTGPTDVRPQMPRPEIPRPPQSAAPSERPKAIPRP